MQWQNYQWMILYEFVIDSNDLWRLDDYEILSKIISTRILGESMNHPELTNLNLDLQVQNLGRPFNFVEIKPQDFDHFSGYDDYNRIIREFADEDEWGDDKEDFKALVIKSDYSIRERTSFENGFWFLNKDKFINDETKIDEIHWIYTYWLVFIEIDKSNRIIRTIDFGYD